MKYAIIPLKNAILVSAFSLLAPVSLQAQTSTYYFPQLADGGGYVTTFYFTSLIAANTNVTVDVFDQNGAGLFIQTNRGTGSTFSFSLPGRSETILRTLGSPPAIQVGWTRVTSGIPIGVTEVFQFLDGSGRVVSQAGVLPVSPTGAATVVVSIDGRGQNTGIAVSNVGAAVNPIAFSLYDQTGTLLGTSSVTLPPRNQIARFIDQLPGFERLSLPFDGSLEISGSALFSPVALLLNGLQLSTLAVLPGRTPARTSSTVQVLGITDLWLAGMPDGTVVGASLAPLNSPVEAGVDLIPGRELEFSPSGQVSPGAFSGSVGPEGGGFGGGCSRLASNIAYIAAPAVGLIGVFLGASRPGPPAPPSLDFSGGLKDLPLLQPMLQQPFYIGGGTAQNRAKRFVIPDGATRLFLAPNFCGFGSGPSGAFTVTVRYGQ
jgi:hypothetical protein